MDRRGFVTVGMAAGLAGVGGVASLPGGSDGSLARALERAGLARVGKTLSDGTVRLSSNENPLGLSPLARQAVVEALVEASRYPGEWSARVQEAVAARLGVQPANVVLGAGSTEILQMAVQAFQGPRTPLVLAEPTFEDVPRYQRPFPFEMAAVPLTADMSHDLGRMRVAAEAGGRPALVYLCNPNNPTGTLTPSRDIHAWIDDAPETTLFLVDEAYHEYVRDGEYESALKWIAVRRNVIVVRTFSKIYGMAGLRLGYGIAHASTAQRLRDFVSSNSVSVTASAAALASLEDPDMMARSLRVNDEAKAIAVATLDELGLEHLPTHANFIMHRIRGDLRDHIARMRANGVRVGRAFPPMVEWNRVSFGLPEEMGRWAEVLRRMRAAGQA